MEAANRVALVAGANKVIGRKKPGITALAGEAQWNACGEFAQPSLFALLGRVRHELVVGVLRLKRAEAERELSEVRSRHARVEARLAQIEREHEPPTHEVALRAMSPTTVASVRGVEPTPASLGRRIEEVDFLVGEGGFATGGSPFVLFHHEGFRERNLDAEVCVPVRSGASLDIPVFGGGRLRGRVLSGAPDAAGVVYRGPYGSLVGPYAALGAWIAAAEYRTTGSARETYLRGGEDPVTEIQYPVKVS